MLIELQRDRFVLGTTILLFYYTISSVAVCSLSTLCLCYLKD